MTTWTRPPKAKNWKHGMTETKLYSVWRNMLNRCGNGNVKSYATYGAKGISVSLRWLDFLSFFEDMGQPEKGMTIERIDNSLGYSKENCRWATRMEQTRNYSRNRNITIRGRTLCLMDWSRESGINWATIRTRIENGWGEEDAVFAPVAAKYRHKGV